MPTSSNANKNSELIEKLYQELIKKISRYNPDFDKERLDKAFELSKKAHKKQFRDSGEPYIIHPLSVATILTDYYADEEAIIAALLHDAIEDSDFIDSELVKKEFGMKIAHLVESVTDIRKFLPRSNDPSLTKRELDIETLRNIFEKSKKDLRVLIIKLADRYHNISTLDTKKDEEKRRNKALETLNIYMPLAARLGVWKMKRALEKELMHHLYPDDEQKIMKFLKATSHKRNSLLNSVISKIKKNDDYNLIKIIKHYDRGLFTLRQFLKDEQKLDINNNLIVRVIVKDEKDCYLFLSLVHRLWQNREEEEDLISNARDNQYQAYHIAVRSKSGYKIQFRVMSEEMASRNWYGATYDLFRGDGKVCFNFLGEFEKISQSTKGSAEDFLEAAQSDLLDHKKQIHNEGQTYNIPVTATALDAVFYIDGDEALKTKKIFVNDREVSFTKSLNEGDTLKIIFGKKRNVEFGWFYQIKTASAKLAIQTALRKWDLRKKIGVGRQILQKEIDLYSRGDLDNVLDKRFSKLKRFFHVENKNDLMVLIAEGNLQPFEVFIKLFPKTKKRFWAKISDKLDKFFEKFSNPRKTYYLRLKIDGIIDKTLDVIHEIHNIRRKLDISLIKSKLTEDTASNTFRLIMNCKSHNRQAFHDFLVDLEGEQGIIRTVPLLSIQKQTRFVFWSFLTLFMWILLPFILTWTQELVAENGKFLRTFLIYLNLVPVLIFNYILYTYLRNYFVQFRNNLYLVLTSFLLNFGGIGVFAWQLMKHDLQVDLFIVLAIFFILNFVFLFHFLGRRLAFYKVDSTETLQLEKGKVPVKKKILAYSLGLFSTFIWGINPVMIRHLVIGSEDIIFFTVGMRLYLGGLFLLGFLFLLKIFKINKSVLGKVRYNKYFWLMTVGLGFSFVFFHWGLKYTIASNANLIENFAPIIVLLVMGFLLPKFSYEIGMSKKDVLLTFLIVSMGSIGASLILSYFPEEFFSDYGSKLMGDFIEVFAMILFAMFIIGSNLYMKSNGASSIQVTSRVLLISALLVTPFMLFKGIPTLTTDQWFWLGMIGVVSTGIAYTLWNYAAKYLNVIPASLLLNFTVIVTLTVENRLTGLPLGAALIIGAILMLLASFSAEIMNMRREKIVDRFRE